MKKSLSIAVLALVVGLVGSANAALQRSYLFESQSGPATIPNDATTPDATGNADAFLLGPEGVEADAGGTVPRNGRLKKAENVLKTTPYGGASEGTYAGYDPESLSAALWFKSDGAVWSDPTESWTSLLGIGNSPGGSPDVELALAKTDGGGATNGGYMQSFSWTGGNSWTSTDPLKQGLPGQMVLDDSTWHHVVLTLSPYDGSGANPATEIYIDGELAATGPASGRAAQGAGGLQIGQNVAFGSYFKGWVDNLHVYNHELSASDVQNLFISETDLVGPAPENYAWKADTSGDWNAEFNWSPQGGPPGNTNASNFEDHTVTLGDVILSTRTVFSDIGNSLREITFDSPHGYVVAGSGTMSLVASTAGATSIQVDQGQNEFQLRVSLETDTAVNAASGATLDFNNQIDLNGNTLDTSPSAGTVNFNHSVIGGGAIIASAALGTAGSTSIAADLTLSGASTLAIDLGNLNTDFFDVTGDVVLDALSVVDVTLEAGFVPTGSYTILSASGTLTDGGLTLDPSDTGLFSLAVNSNSVVLTALAGVPGDFDGNGVVDGLDFLTWQRDLGDATNLGIWQGNYGAGALAAAAGAAAVPEPTSLLLTIAGVIGLTLNGGRRSRSS